MLQHGRSRSLRYCVWPERVLPREESISYLHYLSDALMKSIYLRYRFLMGSRVSASLIQLCGVPCRVPVRVRKALTISMPDAH
jgi:hypothetical protein